jgi:guanosine-3',5'-bis(diphosphate) 3'-pyrophosphohydrolase
MKERLEQVKEFAAEAHGLQLRKYGGDLYIVHPVRVMATCKAYAAEEYVLAAALLHDVLEDTKTGKEEIYRFLSGLYSEELTTTIVSLVEELTDVFTKDAYPEWNRRTRKAKELERLKQISAAAQTIRYADILDNSSEIVENDPGFAGRLLGEYRDVLEQLDKGNAALRARTLAQVNRALQYCS